MYIRHSHFWRPPLPTEDAPPCSERWAGTATREGASHFLGWFSSLFLFSLPPPSHSRTTLPTTIALDAFGLGLHPYITTHTLHETSSTFHSSTLLSTKMRTSQALFGLGATLLQGGLVASGAIPISIRASDDNTCGPNYDNKICDGGDCCSRAGFCVSRCRPP
jgi:hypothetical protein